jgi:flagellar hook-associated protein 3 FlgL
VSLLNTEVDGRYVFSGLSNDTRPVAPADAILNGVAGQSGFKQVMAERAQADLGGSLADPVLTGRLDFTSAGTVTSVAENGGGVFGLRLDATAGASTSSSNIQITGPSGAPNRLDIDVLGGVNLGETLRLTYTLPDGTSRDVVLTSASERSAGQSAFVIDADPAVTAANIQTALREVTDGIARRELPAASASRAGRDFFDEVPPLRVVPYATNGIAGATALVADAAGTLTWYRGEDGPLDARSTSSTRVDDAVRLAYGARANEDALRTTLRELAVFSAQTFDVSDPAAADRYAQVAQRSRSALDDPSGANLPRSIALEIGTANTLMEATKDRHISTRAIFDDILDGTDGVTEEEVAAKLLNIQTRLEASYAVTAMLRDLSLVNYLR